MLNDTILIDYINNEFENEFLDFKLNIYDWSITKCKEDFLIDVISLANSTSKGEKYIITGAKVKPDGERIIQGIEIAKVKDSAIYQELVTENIEPSISIEFKILDYNNYKFGIFKIFNCDDKPYLLKKKYGDLENGFIKVRKGSRNTNISRYLLDSIYKLKIPERISNFKISGIVDTKISDTIYLKKYDFFPNMYEEREKCISLLNEINQFNIDDIVTDSNSLQKTADLLTNGFMKSEPLKIQEKISLNIKSVAEVMEIKLNDNFFDIGNAGKRFKGISTGILVGNIEYVKTGSSKSLKKYKMILELNEKIEQLVDWGIFLEKVKNYKFIQLAITETGNLADEEIEVSLEIPNNAYVDNESFPSVSDVIIKDINENYSRKMFMPEYNNSISDFRRMPLSTSPYIPTPLSLPLYYDSGSNEKKINTIYDYIDYNVFEKEDKTNISFTIKNLKEKETMIFPGNIILKDKIDNIEYSIISKNSKNKISGTLNILE